MSKRWTPGPWIVERNSDGLFVRADAPFPDDWYVARASANNGTTAANAALMAASPALFDALERLCNETTEEQPATRSAWEQAREAMSLALAAPRA